MKAGDNSTGEPGAGHPAAGIPATRVSALESESEKFEIPFSEGMLVFRRWSCPGPDCEAVLLVHGGSGSWSHWYRNIEYLRQRFDVFAVDLPGLGDSSALAADYGAEDAVSAVSSCLESSRVLSTSALSTNRSGALHLVGFSWGCVVASQVAKSHKLKSLMLLGPAAVGDILRRGLIKPLIRRTKGMSSTEVFAANKENLARLMIYNREEIDDLAVYLQTINTNRSRFNSAQFATTTLALDGVKAVTTPLMVLYGEHDAAAGGRAGIELRRELFQAVRPDMTFEIVPDAGHWLQYEQSELFNKKLEQWVEQNT